MIKKAFLAAAVAATALSATAQAPAFPGAEGHARYSTTGGRGGKVLHVTNLNDSGEGSLRWAVSQSGARTVVFDVSGTIELKSDLKISNDNISILGQTAPGEGITLAYYTVNMDGGAHNVIIRFIRVRRSQVKNVNDGADAMFGRNRKNRIIDHCSLSWSIDEVASFYDNQNFSLQWCYVTEGLCNPGHSKGAHSYGGIWGGKEASFHHDFIAHVQNRAPRFNGARYQSTNFDKTRYLNTVDAERVDFRNCVMYNWGNGSACYGGPGGGYVNMVNNYYKAGPGTKNKRTVTQVTVGASGNSTPEALYGYASRYYINGNYVTDAGDDAADYDWKGVLYDGGLVTIDGDRYIKDATKLYGADKTYVDNNGTSCIRLRLDEPMPFGDVTTHSAEQSYDKVLTYGGACIFRDAVDVRITEEARTGTVTFNGDVPYVDSTGKTYAKSGTKGIPDWVNDPANPEQNPGVPSFPVIAQTSRPADFDTDGDGMPDVWETNNGLNPADPADGNLYTLDPKGWYTNLEVYANGIVEHIIKAQNADALSPLEEYYPAADHSSGIAEIAASDAEIIGFEYYTIQGVRLEEPTQGINIRRIIYSDGRIVTDKVLKR